MRVAAHRRNRVAAGLAALGLLAVAGAAGAQALTIRNVHIESVPSGAEVEVIGGKAGRTPLTLSERDLYPNTYPDARAEWYGIVGLSHAGCEPLRHRVTGSEIGGGLTLRLDCNVAASGRSARDAQPAAAPIAKSPADLSPAAPPSGAAAVVVEPATPTRASAPTNAGTTRRVAASANAAAGNATPSSPPAETDAQRRLRQLQVLQELLDEGILSPAEEQRLRRRILAEPAGR